MWERKAVFMWCALEVGKEGGPDAVSGNAFHASDSFCDLQEELETKGSKMAQATYKLKQQLR